MEASEALERARVAYEHRLASVVEGDWDRPTPCPGWSVRHLAGHVVGCALLYAELLGGARAEDVLPRLHGSDLLGGDPLGATRAAWEALAAPLGGPEGLEGDVHHPVGEIPAAWLRVTAVEELVVHGWDLARATGADATVDEELASWLVGPLGEMIGRFGAAFAAPTAPAGAGATASERLLALTGRA